MLMCSAIDVCAHYGEIEWVCIIVVLKSECKHAGNMKFGLLFCFVKDTGFIFEQNIKEHVCSVEFIVVICYSVTQAGHSCNTYYAAQV